MNSTIKSYAIVIALSAIYALSTHAMAPGSMIDRMGKGHTYSQGTNQPKPVALWNGATSGKQYQPATPALKWISGSAAAAGAIWIARKVITKR